MTHHEPLPPPDKRPPWRFIGITLALLVMATFCWRNRPGKWLPSLEGKTQLTQSVVVQRVESVAKLVTSETTVRDVVMYENKRLGSTKRSLMVVTGKILAGIDLAGDGDSANVRIDHAERSITVVLPPAKVLAVTITDLKTYDESSGLLNPFRPADRDEIQRRVREQLEKTAKELDILAHADSSAKELLKALFTTDGYEVRVVRDLKPFSRPEG
ncbi:MAG: DUF4230 domain-containing protein [Gemmatimonadaceae bacterium]|nr:DUF4230 domain-containing protein [Gemmatimonadaceae bacterium]MDQ3519587.1 DUF4230 domain-containing protein [Gemmatimonadota bacterium]